MDPIWEILKKIETPALLICAVVIALLFKLIFMRERIIGELSQQLQRNLSLSERILLLVQIQMGQRTPKDDQP